MTTRLNFHEFKFSLKDSIWFQLLKFHKSKQSAKFLIPENFIRTVGWFDATFTAISYVCIVR